MIRGGYSPKKLYKVAVYAFDGIYDSRTILHWLKTFTRRFFTQQYKRSCLPDGVRTGTVAISPRGAWCMPSDACYTVWQKEIDELEYEINK